MTSSTEITVISGLGYSDEGKGHITQLIAHEYDVILRCNGSWSSSHQVTKDTSVLCHHMPSSLNLEQILIIGEGMFIKPDVLIAELEQDIRKKQMIYISENCFVIMDESKPLSEIGTLGSGVRHASIEKINHKGIRIKELVENGKYTELKAYLISDDEYFNLTNGKKILIEGSHGYKIDCNFGDYPYTTSTITSPTGILYLSKYGAECHKDTIFVTGLILSSLSIHPDHQTYEQLGLSYLESYIPENVRYDKACGKPLARNFGPFNIDMVKKIIRYHSKCLLYLTFFDLIDNMGVFHYIKDDTLMSLYKSKGIDFKSEINNLLTKELNRMLIICDPPKFIKS